MKCFSCKSEMRIKCKASDATIFTCDKCGKDWFVCADGKVYRWIEGVAIRGVWAETSFKLPTEFVFR